VSGAPHAGIGSLVVNVAIIGAAADLGFVNPRLPENARQVPEDVFNHRPLPSALRFGYELGTGVMTYAPAVAPYVAALALLAFGEEFATAVLVGVSFGIGRFLMPLARVWSVDGEAWDRLLVRQTGAMVGSTGTIAATATVWLAMTA